MATTADADALSKLCHYAACQWLRIQTGCNAHGLTA